MVCSQPACSAAAAESLQSCPTLCDPMNCSLSGSSVHGILQARILEWVAISCSRGSSWSRDQTCLSCISYTGRWILYHCATREAPQTALLYSLSLHNILNPALPFSTVFTTSSLGWSSFQETTFFTPSYKATLHLLKLDQKTSQFSHIFRLHFWFWFFWYIHHIRCYFLPLKS